MLIADDPVGYDHQGERNLGRKFAWCGERKCITLNATYLFIYILNIINISKNVDKHYINNIAFEADFKFNGSFVHEI